MADKDHTDDVTDKILGHLGQYDSSYVSSDEDGGVLQRLESLKNDITPGTRLIKSKDYSETVQIDDKQRLQLNLFDLESGAVLSADITAGTYDVDRVRGGTTTSIASDVALSKSDGIVYVDYTFGSTDWDEGDIFLISFKDTQAVIDGDTYQVGTQLYSGRISQEVDIENKVDAVQTDIGDFSSKTNNDSLIETLGFPDDVDGELIKALGHNGVTDLDTGLMAQLQDYVTDDSDSIYDRIGDPTTRTNFTSIKAMLGIPDEAGTTLFNILSYGYDGSSVTANKDGGIIQILKYLAEDTMDRNSNSGTLTADGTEQTLFEYSDSEPWILKQGKVDLTNMASGDTILLKKYAKIKSGGSYRLEDKRTFNDAQAVPLETYGEDANVYGIKITIEQTAGTYRDYDHEWIEVS